MNANMNDSIIMIEKILQDKYNYNDSNKSFKLMNLITNLKYNIKVSFIETNLQIMNK